MTRVFAGLLGALVVALGLLAPTPTRGEPYFAQREGYKCSKCHLNRSGGGKRTDFGVQYALTHLDAMELGSTPAHDGTMPRPERSIWQLFDPRLNEFVAIGGNYRLTHNTTFADEVHNGFGNHEANLYLEVDLMDILALYVDISVAEGGVENREAFALLSGLMGFHIKAGFMLLPYGLRIWGDEEYIRSETGFHYAAPDLGLEVGFEDGPFSAFVAVSNGAGGGLDGDNEKKVSGLFELSWPAFRVGVSGSYNRTKTRTEGLGGLYLGASLWRLTLLAEADVVATTYHEDDDTVLSLVAYAEAGLLISKGFHAKVSYGYHDPALDVDEDQRFRLSAGLEFYPIPYLAARLFYTFKASVPQDEIGNADVLLAELHLFF